MRTTALDMGDVDQVLMNVNVTCFGWKISSECIWAMGKETVVSISELLVFQMSEGN